MRRPETVTRFDGEASAAEESPIIVDIKSRRSDMTASGRVFRLRWSIFVDNVEKRVRNFARNVY